MSGVWVLIMKNEGCRNDNPLSSTLWAMFPLLVEVHKLKVQKNWN